MSGSIQPELTSLRTYCVSGGLSEDTINILESQSLSTLDHLRALEDGDLDKLSLPLGEKILLRARAAELKGSNKPGGARKTALRHEYKNATYKNDDAMTSWQKGTFIMTPSTLSFIMEDNSLLFHSRIDCIYHIQKSDSTFNIWPFRTNAINIFADNVKHKVHLGNMRDSVYEKLSIFFESRKYMVA